MNPIQTYLDIYKTHNDETITREVDILLSDEDTCKVIQTWLNSHRTVAHISPMISKLQNRIRAPSSEASEVTPIFFSALNIENKILNQNIDELIDFFNKSPKEFLGHIDLIKMHIELKTLSENDIRKLLPVLLDHASTQDIGDILSISPPVGDIPQALTKQQLIRLTAALPKNQDKATLPPFAIALTEFLEKKEEDLRTAIDKINAVDGLNEEEKNSLMAHYIERHEIPLKDLKGILSDEKLLKLAPYLRYVNLKDFDVELGKNILKKCKYLNYLRVADGRILEGLIELPFCQKLSCLKCTNLTALPKLPMCKELFCKGSTHLTSLPELPLCEKLDCSNCTDLTSLPKLPHCKVLFCKDCTRLTSLPELSLCEELYCYGCTHLTSLPKLPMCKELYCGDCTRLTSLPELSLCEELYCYGCTHLSSLPQLPLCKKLYCYGCTHLTSLPQLSLCEELYCQDCTHLTSLPQLPLCKKLHCQDCTNLTSLPGLPRCQELECYGCPLNELPELPFGAEVISVEEGVQGLPFTSLNIDIEKFTTDPKSLLLQVGEHLLQNKPMPNIYYFEKGERNSAIDVGGVRRDFFSKIFMHIFQENGLKMEGSFPVAAPSNETNETAYRTLGCLMALSYPQNSFYKTGPLFDPNVYQYLGEINLAPEDWFLTNYLDKVGVSKAVLQLVNLNKECPTLEEADLSKLPYILDPENLDPSIYNQTYLSSQENRKKVRKTILKYAMEDLNLKAIRWMGEELTKRVQVNKNDLQRRVEGVLDKESLIKKLQWEDGDDEQLLGNALIQRTKNYLTTWINTHETELQKFVYAVTGIRALCSKPVGIKILNREEGFVPTSHTCFFTLDVGAHCKDQEQFDKNMGIFLANALHASGFTNI